MSKKKQREGGRQKHLLSRVNLKVICIFDVNEY